MEPSRFDEISFFRGLALSGARALLIGRRALVLLGLPLLTADYDFWIEMDDIEAFNAAGAQFDLLPTRTPGEARRRGRYVLENDEHVDVLVARSVPTVTGEVLEFPAVWGRRRAVSLGGVDVQLPSLDDLVSLKQIDPRPKDLEDIRLLRILKEQAR